MSKNGKPELSAGLIATKGSAAPAADMPPRAALASTPPAPAKQDEGEPITSLNFKVPQSFGRAFKAYAGAHGLKLNELLQLSFDAYRKQKGS